MLNNLGVNNYSGDSIRGLGSAGPGHLSDLLLWLRTRCENTLEVQDYNGRRQNKNTLKIYYRKKRTFRIKQETSSQTLVERRDPSEYCNPEVGGFTNTCFPLKVGVQSERSNTFPCIQHKTPVSSSVFTTEGLLLPSDRDLPTHVTAATTFILIDIQHSYPVTFVAAHAVTADLSEAGCWSVCLCVCVWGDLLQRSQALFYVLYLIFGFP